MGAFPHKEESFTKEEPAHVGSLVTMLVLHEFRKKIFDIVECEERIMLQVTEPLLEQLTGDDLKGNLEYYKEDFNIGGYTYQKDKD